MEKGFVKFASDNLPIAERDKMRDFLSSFCFLVFVAQQSNRMHSGFKSSGCIWQICFNLACIFKAPTCLQGFFFRGSNYCCAVFYFLYRVGFVWTLRMVPTYHCHFLLLLIFVLMSNLDGFFGFGARDCWLFWKHDILSCFVFFCKNNTILRMIF